MAVEQHAIYEEEDECRDVEAMCWAVCHPRFEDVDICVDECMQSHGC